MYKVYRGNQYLGEFEVINVGPNHAVIDMQHKFSRDDVTCYCGHDRVVVLKRDRLPALQSSNTNGVDLSTVSEDVRDAISEAMAA